MDKMTLVKQIRSYSICKTLGGGEYVPLLPHIRDLLCDLAIQSLSQESVRSEALARPEWDGYIRFDSDCVVNGTAVKAGTSWGPFEKSKNTAREDVHSTELRK